MRKVGEKDNFVITTPPEHYNDEFITEENIAEKSESESGFVFSDDKLQYNHILLLRFLQEECTKIKTFFVDDNRT